MRLYNIVKLSFIPKQPTLYNDSWSIKNTGRNEYTRGQGKSRLAREHRDRTYIRRDIILMLSEYGELNQTRLISYCGLNMNKHKEILVEMEQKGLLDTSQEPWGSKTIVKYKVTAMGLEFYRKVLEPYTSMFPKVEPTEGGDDR